MRHTLAVAALLLLFGCQCGARAKDKAARAPSNVIDAREIARATGTAAPYVEPPQQGEREEDRKPVSGGPVERTPEPPASPIDDPPIPTTGPFAEQAPDEEREVPADLPPPDAAVAPAWDAAAPAVPDIEVEPPPSAPLEDAGNPLPNPDAHGR